MGFSRQEYWSGVPLPSPLSRVQLFVTPWTVSPPGPSVHGILQARILERVVIPFSRDLSHPGIELGPPALQVDSLPSEKHSFY